jgi:hypothetical protein
VNTTTLSEISANNYVMVISMEDKKIYQTNNLSSWKKFQYTIGMQVSLLIMISFSSFFDSEFKVVFMICAFLLALYYCIKGVKEIKKTREFIISQNHFIYEGHQIPFDKIREIVFYKGNIDIITSNKKEFIRMNTNKREDLEELKLEISKTIKNSGIKMRNEY